MSTPVLLQPASPMFLIIFFLSFLLDVVVSTAETPINSICPGDTYASNSSFRDNLSNLLSRMSSQASLKWYDKASMGQSPDQVYALYFCRGDVDQEACQSCVGNATIAIVKDCPNNKDAMIWYEKCLFRYSSSSFFGIVDGAMWWFTNCNEPNITDVDVSSFMRQVQDTLTDMATLVAGGDQLSGKKFATKEVEISGTAVTLYALGQCSEDLLALDCRGCLKDSMDNLVNSGQCFGTRGGALYYGTSCYVRYDIFPFYQIAAPAVPVLPPNPAGVAGNKSSNHLSPKVIVAVVLPVVVAVLLVGTIIYFRTRTRIKEKPLETVNASETVCDAVDADDFVAVESLQYDFGTLQVATDYFSGTNMIGKGGSSEVYKGRLADGQEIAVKKLLKISDQGVEEFKNEVNLVAKLHHKNLVRLLGFCLTKDEKMLVYEFVPNRSLDYFLFDPERQSRLDWSARYKIVRGIARGLLYLHEDSRPRIIHRDLKASNILLDMDMSPKISDFGLARVFGMDQTHNETERVAGTFGYMAPEYLLCGQFSVKSDVYSFGVLVLEIVSGKKNTSFHQTGLAEDLLSYAWKRWIDGRALEFLDPTLRESNYSSVEVKLCIQLGLLCVQKDTHKRPSMGRIVHMLNSHSVSALPVPQQPPFFTDSSESSTITEQGVRSDPSSIYDASFSEMGPR